MRSRSTRRSVEATTWMRRPLSSNNTTSPGSGMRPSISLTSPPSVVASYSSVHAHFFAKETWQLIHREIAGDDPNTAGLALRIVDVRIFLMLVADVADNLFEQIFDRHQAGDASVLIDDDAHVLLFALHLAE